MNNRYEALLILNTKGGDDSAKEIIDRLEGEFTAEGAKIESIQKMDRRPFSYVAGKLDSGYFVNFIFEAPAATIEKLDARFRLDKEVYRRNFVKLPVRKTEAAA